jgi:hypothetical protein
MPKIQIEGTWTRQEVRLLALNIVEALSGHGPDPHGIAKGFAARVAMTFFELVKANFIKLSRGGTGADGTVWPPLTKEYLAYGRSAEKALRWKDGRRIGTDVGGLAPGRHADGRQYNGYMDKDQLAKWYSIYRSALHLLAAREPISEAKIIAAKIAWARMKEAGVKTKIKELGERKVEILRDTGLLFNSLTPGTIMESAGSANYSPANEHQVYKHLPKKIIVGTNCSYAKFAHNAKDPKRRRRLWPDELPEAWTKRINTQVRRGIVQSIMELTKR